MDYNETQNVTCWHFHAFIIFIIDLISQLRNLFLRWRMSFSLLIFKFRTFSIKRQQITSFNHRSRRFCTIYIQKIFSSHMLIVFTVERRFFKRILVATHVLFNFKKNPSPKNINYVTGNLKKTKDFLWVCSHNFFLWFHVCNFLTSS